MSLTTKQALRAEVEFECGLENGILRMGREVMPDEVGVVRRTLDRILPGRKSVGPRFFPVEYENGVRVHLGSLSEALVVEMAKNVDLRQCGILVKSKSNVIVEYYVDNDDKNSCLRLKLIPSDSTSAESPLTVAVTIIPPENEDIGSGTSTGDTTSNPTT